MKLRILFYILATLLFIVWALTFNIILKDAHGIMFYLIEGTIILSLGFLVYFYRKVIKPFQTIGNGMELLREQDFSSRLRKVGQMEADRIVEIFNRMMEQLKNERLQVREQNHFLDLLINASPMGVIILDFEDRISILNAAAIRFLNVPNGNNLEGHTFKELESPLANELTVLKKGTTKTIRFGNSMIYRCSLLSFADRGASHPFVLLESLTSEVMKAEKKAYEKVIRMIAHEVNNTTAGISSTLESVIDALQETPTADDLTNMRDVMSICVERCYNMSHFITNFADVVKIPEPQLELVNLNEQVKASKIFMENICNSRNIKLHLDLCTDIPMVNIDTSLFEQVITNIVKNSAESIGNNGDIFIKTTTSPIVLEIADTGPGISKEVETKLFSPFFSTKPNGQGIGLIFIREVLMKHHCDFSLRTCPDGLTRFNIYFASHSTS